MLLTSLPRPLPPSFLCDGVCGASEGPYVSIGTVYVYRGINHEGYKYVYGDAPDPRPRRSAMYIGSTSSPVRVNSKRGIRDTENGW